MAERQIGQGKRLGAQREEAGGAGEAEGGAVHALAGGTRRKAKHRRSGEQRTKAGEKAGRAEGKREAGQGRMVGNAKRGTARSKRAGVNNNRKVSSQFGEPGGLSEAKLADVKGQRQIHQVCWWHYWNKSLILGDFVQFSHSASGWNQGVSMHSLTEPGTGRPEKPPAQHFREVP